MLKESLQIDQENIRKGSYQISHFDHNKVEEIIEKESKKTYS